MEWTDAISAINFTAGEEAALQVYVMIVNALLMLWALRKVTKTVNRS